MATIFTLIFLFLFLFSSALADQENPHLAPAIYIFGDSTVDGGNSDITYPYGLDLNSSLPRRASNGKTIADYIATFLGLPLVPPYKNLPQASSSTTGVNYGYAGCGILPQTGSGCWSFDVQISKFNSTLSNDLSKLFNQVELLQQHLKHSIFLVSFGINDYNLDYIQPNNGTLRTLTPDVFAQFLLNELSGRLRTLYNLGARKFLINNIWPMGCTPLYANQSDPLAICCNESINQLLMPYNNSLPTTLMKLQSDLPGSVFSNSDDFRFVSDLKSNVARYGISNTTGSCLSEYFGGTPCADRDRYLYFDMVHTTQAANYVFSLNCFNGTLCSPGNIISLVGAQVY